MCFAMQSCAPLVVDGCKRTHLQQFARVYRLKQSCPRHVAQLCARVPRWAAGGRARAV